MTSMSALIVPHEPTTRAAGPDEESVISRALQSVRTHLGMQVAYVSEFVGDRTVFREVDAPGLEHLIKVGDSHALDDVYCRHIIEGRLPSLMSDTSEVPFAAAMPITGAVPIGKHMSIPLTFSDGEVYGMFCCLGPQADHSLNDRDLQTLKVFADFAAHEIRREVEGKKAEEVKNDRITKVISEGQMSIVYQPIWNIQKEVVVGFECLTRFSALPYRTPDIWFNEAAEVDLGPMLELAAIKMALAGLGSLPPRTYLGVNASPQTIMAPEFALAFKRLPLDRIVIEITEHAEVEDYAALRRVVDPLRDRGIRLAVDDAGAGYSGLQHILKLQPDLIKLDLALTRNIDVDIARRALASALVNFAEATDCEIIAEGVETEFELKTLKELGVQKAQGYFLGPPSSLDQVLCALEYGAGTTSLDNKTNQQDVEKMEPTSKQLCALEYGPAQ